MFKQSNILFLSALEIEVLGYKNSDEKYLFAQPGSQTASGDSVSYKHVFIHALLYDPLSVVACEFYIFKVTCY